MMKKIVTIFAGRQQYMECLLAHLARQRSSFDELHICANARNTRDAAYLEQYAAAHTDFVTLVQRSNIELGYLDFYNQMDRSAVYLKLDDDIVFIGKNAIADMFAARLADTTSLLISGRIINGDRSADANNVHQSFITAAKAWDINGYRTPTTPVPPGMFSINAICFYPRDLPTFKVYQSDERLLTTVLPEQLGKSSVVCGSAVFAHYSFAGQGVNAVHLKNYRALAGVDYVNGGKMYFNRSGIDPQEIEAFKACGKDHHGMVEIDPKSDCWRKIIADRLERRRLNPDVPNKVPCSKCSRSKREAALPDSRSKRAEGRK